ncbi:Uncharacterised protein [Mycobacterium tuberculosis]|nr:Uncharacterised protein [Mycobacterium tuberculosis]
MDGLIEWVIIRMVTMLRFVSSMDLQVNGMDTMVRVHMLISLLIHKTQKLYIISYLV